MARQIPPLKALRAFEAAGRHLSFSKAADELCVTAGAISRQIKLLEDRMGLHLFRRGHREVELTPPAERFLRDMTDIFNRIESSTAALVGVERDRPLHIVCPMTFTTRWLVPRLPDFHRQYPDQNLRITTTLSVLQNLPNSTDVDVGFQLSAGKVSGWETLPVARSRLVPVCSPALLAPAKRLDDIADLQRFPILHSTARRSAWGVWAKGAGVDLSQTRALEFASTTLAYEAAKQGIGIALGDLSLIERDLIDGTLVIALDQIVDSGMDYCLIYAQESARSPHILKFRRWIQRIVAAEAAADQPRAA